MRPAWIDGRPAAMLPLSDRGLCYGDGVFESLLVHDGCAVWLEAHLDRLQRGCDALGFPPPARALLEREIAAFAGESEHAVLRLVVTRGDGARGYAPPREPQPRRILSLHEATRPSLRLAREGLQLRWCDLQLASQPRLAGVKHLNRLEQVLARAEWNDPAIDEGLMCDREGRVICATAANLMLRRGDRWLTPDLVECGIAGTCRRWVMSRLPVQEVAVSREDVERCDALFLCNSLRGILPVARLGGRSWGPDRMTQALQESLWDEVAALRPQQDPA